MARARITGSTPRPVTRMMRMAPMSRGKAKKVSATLMITVSDLRPR
jgi:hypothetical protein